MSRNMIFTTPCIYKSNGFGCASFGFAGAPDYRKEEKREWGNTLQGQIFYGKLQDVLNEVRIESHSKNWNAGIVLFGNCGNENSFVHELQSIINCALTGGAAAFDPEDGRVGLISGCGEVAVYLIEDSNVRVVSKNIHNHVLGMHEIGYSGRFMETIDGEDALIWYTKRRKEYGFSNTDFEHMTFSDENGVNAHLSLNGGKLFSGRDLSERMILRYVDKGSVFPQMYEFYNDSNAIIFGCAGLKGILEENIMTESMGMFLFGEVTTINGVAEFGNLMLSKLVIEKAKTIKE